MENTLIYDKPINIGNILEFTVPTMIRMLFVSMYTIVDGIVVSNYVGSLGLSAINIVFPVLNICMAVTFVFEMGGNALIGKEGAGMQLFQPYYDYKPGCHGDHDGCFSCMGRRNLYAHRSG